jgi:hypothetical protein
MVCLRERITIALTGGARPVMTTIVLAVFATVGVGTLALISYLFYLSHGSRDRLE